MNQFQKISILLKRTVPFPHIFSLLIWNMLSFSLPSLISLDGLTLFLWTFSPIGLSSLYCTLDIFWQVVVGFGGYVNSWPWALGKGWVNVVVMFGWVLRRPEGVAGTAALVRNVLAEHLTGNRPRAAQSSPTGPQALLLESHSCLSVSLLLFSFLCLSSISIFL